MKDVIVIAVLALAVCSLASHMSWQEVVVVTALTFLAYMRLQG